LDLKNCCEKGRGSKSGKRRNGLASLPEESIKPSRGRKGDRLSSSIQKKGKRACRPREEKEKGRSDVVGTLSKTCGDFSMLSKKIPGQRSLAEGEGPGGGRKRKNPFASRRERKGRPGLVGGRVAG